MRQPERWWRLRHVLLAGSALGTSAALLGPVVTAGLVAAAVTAALCILSVIGFPIFLTLASTIADVAGKEIPFAYYAKYGISLLLLGLLLLRWTVRPTEVRGVPSRIDRVLVLFLLWGVVSAAFANEPVRSLSESLRLLAFLPVFLATRAVVSKPSHVVAIALASVIAICLNAAFGALEWSHLGYHRVRGMLGNANFLGMVLMFTIPLAYTGVIAARSRLLKRLCALGTALGVLLLLLSMSRAAIVCFLCTVVIFLFLERRRKLLLALAAVGIVGLTLIAANPTSRALITAALRLEAGTTHRVMLWEYGLAAWQRSPAIGLGYNVPRLEAAGRVNWNDFAQYQQFERVDAPFYPHNMYIYTAMTIGIIGLGLLFWLYLAIMAEQRRGWRQSQSSRQRSLHRLVFAVVAGCLLHGMFESGNIIHYSQWANYFWVLLGVVTASAHRGLLDPPPQFKATA